MTSSILGIVIAGGLSTRMGRDKAALRLGGVSLAARVVERLRPQVTLVAFNGDPAAGPLPPGVAVVADAGPGHLGPLAGILAGLRLAQGQGIPHVVTVAVDTPFFPRDLVRRFADAVASDGDGAGQTIAVAAYAGVLHPVFGLWPSALADDLETFITRDEKRRVRGFIERHPHVMVDIPPGAHGFDPFLNVNRPEDLERAERLLIDSKDDAE